MVDQIQVVSLNCWGLKYVSKNRRARIPAIAGALARSHYDIIALQEVWVEADYHHIRQSVAPRLPYAKLFHSGALGAGLAVFTKWPIIASSITPYSLNGEPIDAFGGDWFVGKGVGSVTIMHPILGQVQIFNTHLYAKGGEKGPEHNRAHRLVNAWEFAKVIRQAAEVGRYVIAAGDFNSIPTSLPMDVILNHSGLVDSWAASHAHIPPPSGLFSPVEGVSKYGITADSSLNSYCSKLAPNSVVQLCQGKRLDYVLFRNPIPRLDDHLPRLTCQKSRVVFTQFIPDNICSYSDHFGIEATLNINTRAETYTSSQNDQSKETPVVCSDISSQLSSSTINKMISALNISYRMSQDRSRKELTIFGMSVLLLIALIVGSPWVVLPWFSPFFVLFVICVSWLATTMLYEGFIFGNWERKALQNVIEEVELYNIVTSKAPQGY